MNTGLLIREGESYFNPLITKGNITYIFYLFNNLFILFIYFKNH